VRDAVQQHIHVEAADVVAHNHIGVQVGDAGDEEGEQGALVGHGFQGVPQLGLGRDEVTQVEGQGAHTSAHL
jgi:hypothetical protein